MFSNSHIKSIASTSDETNLRLSPCDRELVLAANRGFSEDELEWKGDRAWGRFLLSKVPELSNVRWKNSLELCCGNGFLFFSLYHFVEFDDSCHFIDISEIQVSAFRERCRREGVSPPDIIASDIGALPFGNGSLDIVFGNSFLHHLPDVGLYLREAARVLHRGGLFVDFHEPTPSANFLEIFPTSVCWMLQGRERGASLTDIWLIKPQVITKLLHEAGFKAVRIYPNNLLASFFIQPWIEVMSKLGRPPTGRLYHGPRNWMAFVEKVIPYKVRLAVAPSIAIVAVR
jgi:ubiquinone/menaquinone biosynthesis C-methylase UbiE